MDKIHLVAVNVYQHQKPKKIVSPTKMDDVGFKETNL